MKKRTIRKLETFLHFLTSLALLIKSYDEISKKLYFPGLIIAGLALTVVCITIFWRRLKIKPRQARVMCYYIESPALLITAYVLLLERKESLPSLFLVAALLYPAVGFISSKRFRKFSRQIDK